MDIWGGYFGVGTGSIFGDRPAKDQVKLKTASLAIASNCFSWDSGTGYSLESELLLFIKLYFLEPITSIHDLA